jgi:outer membrane scaffolding protein for murein synthesis (MipA/OmpV family)
VLGLRYATAQDVKTYVADLSARYPVSDKLALNPRLRLGYRKDDVAQWEELSAVPSLRLDYQWTRDWNLELEGGAKIARKLQAGTQDDQSEVFVTVGYRYDFNAEGAVVGGK